MNNNDKYMIDGLNATWSGNLENNFFRQIRNFIFDMLDCDSCIGVHWQVAQATQLSNLYFKMKKESKCQVRYIYGKWFRWIYFRFNI